MMPAMADAVDDEEVTRLIRTMVQAQQRLAELTGGQVNAVIDASGQRHLLPAAPEDVLRTATTFHAIFQHAAVGIVGTDADWRIREGNPAFCAMLGRSEGELVGTDFLSLDQGRQQPGWRSLADEVRGAGGEGVVVERRFQGRGGAFLWVRISISARRGPGGRVQGFIAMVEDVTERETHRLALTKALKLQRMAGQTARLGGWEVPVGVSAVTWSNQACAILGLPVGHVSPVREALGFVATGWRRRLFAMLRACLRLGTAFDIEVRLLDARGGCAWVRIAGEAERDEAGSITSVGGAVQDVSGRRAVEEATRRLGERLAARVGNIADAFLMLDGEFRITYANQRALEVLQAGESNPLGRPIWDHAGLEDGGAFGAQLRAASAEPRPVEFELFLERAATWLEVRAFPSDGGLTVTLHDITQRRQEQERLRLLEACVARLDDAILITEAVPPGEPADPAIPPGDTSGPRIVFANDAFLRLAGKNGIAAPRLGPGRIRAAIEKGQPLRAELIHLSREARDAWVELDVVPVADASGLVTHAVAVQRDVTERRRQQVQMEQQAALLDLVQDGILVRGLDGAVSYANRSARDMYGWGPTGVAGTAGEGGPARADAEATGFREARRAVLEAGQWKGRLEQRRGDGSPMVVDSDWTLVRDGEGRPRAILCVHRDITDRLALEERLRQSQRLEAVGQLTGGVAHDFNNLLTVILGSSETLVALLGGDEELRGLAEMTMTAAERGAALTSRLLAFSRRQTLEPRVVEVGAVLGGLASMLERTLGAHIALHLRSAPDLWPALIDQPQLENAVLNLCLNARDAMPGGGGLTIALSNLEVAEGGLAGGELAPGRYVVIEVVDSGTGMVPEVLARAFEPFFTTKEVGQGSGLGLSMVYGFMKQSGGHVELSSAPGRGTTVRLVLKAAAGTAPAALAHPAQEAGGPERVLLVEDDSMVRAHVAAMLRGLGYAVTLANDAAQALARLEEGEPFELIFSDVVMPGAMNGLQLAVRARRMRPGIGLLLTSGYTENAIQQHGSLEPGMLLLSKPYRRHELASKVRMALEEGGLRRKALAGAG